MAAIDGLIAQIEDKVLRGRLTTEVNKLIEEKTFGLVFEDHLPELTPLYSEKIRKGSTVAFRGGDITDVWRVLSVLGKAAKCLNRRNSEVRHIPIDDLVVVLQFGEPIFPSLVPVDKLKNGPDNAPWHTLIEADNYHALQLLEYLYAGQIDCIYIDPPYNTGARDWKYNNDYVDGNDSWRHSKWLAFMRKRLKLAGKLINPDSGVMIVTVDEHELHHLGMLIEQMFPTAYCQVVTIVITARGVAKQGLARVEEYALFIYFGSASASATSDDFLNSKDDAKKRNPWASLLRRGTNAAPSNRRGLVFPILIDPETKEIIGVGETLGDKVERGEMEIRELNSFNPPRTKSEAWPIRSDGALGTWQVSPKRLMDLKKKGFVKIGRFDETRTSWSVNYLKRGPISEIEKGILVINGYEWDGGPAILEYIDEIGTSRRAKTVWHRTLHDAGTYGSGLIREILGNRAFEFPKSIYSVRDALSTVVSEQPNALVLDFFAGSGTTLNALNLMNALDGGSRRCIMVTNNEVSADDADELLGKGALPGTDVWETRGICRSVTWPRSKYTIQGHRDDGVPLAGEYFTGEDSESETPRSIQQISFANTEVLQSISKKKEIVALFGKKNLPQSTVKKIGYVVSTEHPLSVLFNEDDVDEWLEALAEQDHIERLVVVTQSREKFETIKEQIDEILGPMIVLNEKKISMAEGFEANLEYFRLDFLDKNNVQLGNQFRELLPLLWLRSGAVGTRPEVPKRMAIPPYLIPRENSFAVLTDESAYHDFSQALGERDDITHVFLVTDSEEAFHEMASHISAPHCIQLYRDYLENFMINKGEVT